MNGLRYVKNRRYFILFYLMLMGFISLNLLVGGDRSGAQSSALADVIYINTSCLVLTGIYLIGSYYYRRSFYRKQEELVASITEHNRQLNKLHEERRNQQEYILSWIHEVKLPIAASRLALESSEEMSADALADLLEDELNKIEDYVEQALYYSRIDAFAQDYFIVETAVDQVVRGAVKKYAKLFIRKGIRFQMADQDVLAYSDQKWLAFVIDQIIANALKYTDEGGAITVMFEEDNKEKRLLIRDNGIGIRPEDIARIFEKGFTGQTGRTHARSTGMGLYLAKQLALKLGHDLTVSSEHGQYTLVAIHFPKMRRYGDW